MTPPDPSPGPKARGPAWGNLLRTALSSALIEPLLSVGLVGLRKELEDVLLVGRNWDKFAENLSAEHITFDLDRGASEKRKLFKRSVGLVELEPQAFCNRHCTFCPNGKESRRKNKSQLNWKIYQEILGSLAEIDYDGWIRFARYSEPLAAENIVEFVRAAKDTVPNCRVDIISNGDYLNRDLLDRLTVAGLDALRISIYPKGYIWNVSNARVQVERLARRIDLEARETHQDKNSIHWRFSFSQVEVQAIANNFGITGFDRGQTVPELSDRRWTRTTPCYMVFGNFTVDYDGAVVPCCNVRGDLAAHKPLVIDHLGQGRDIFDIYSSQSATNWRKQLCDFGPKTGICASCKQKSLGSQISKTALAQRIGSFSWCRRSGRGRA